MARKRLTQRFPFLLPLRRWQRKRLFYLKMRFDGNRYAKKRMEAPLPWPVCEASSRLINPDSGYDIAYQYNKVHNLKLAAGTIDGVVIGPGETFSFWQLARRADRREKYRDGLTLVDGRIIGAYGGGLCQLSGLLFQLFLHTPMTVIERRGHAVMSFPGGEREGLQGADATVREGWLDLKVRNDTDHTFQIRIGFDETDMYGRILSQRPLETVYTVYNPSVIYVRENGRVYQLAAVRRREVNKRTAEITERDLYRSRCEIGYQLPEDVPIEERECHTV